MDSMNNNLCRYLWVPMYNVRCAYKVFEDPVYFRLQIKMLVIKIHYEKMTLFCDIFHIILFTVMDFRKFG